MRTDDGFKAAIEVALEHEGGLVDHPDDPGGITNYGISLRWAIGEHIKAGDSSLRLLDVTGDGVIDADDIRKMSREQAKHLYRLFFWEPNKYDLLRNTQLQIKLLDLCINMGPRQAHKLAQRAVRAAAGIAIKDDGILGPISFRALNTTSIEPLMAALRSEQAGFYRALVIRNDALRQNGVEVPNFSKFLDGWLRRAYA